VNDLDRAFLLCPRLAEGAFILNVEPVTPSLWRTDRHF
jgi:hypothetical protein